MVYKFDVTLENRLSDCRYTSVFKELRGFSVNSSGNKISNSIKETTKSSKELKRLQSLEDSSGNDSISCSSDDEPLSGKQKSLRSTDISSVEAFDESSNSLNQEENHVNTSDIMKMMNIPIIAAL